MKQWLIIVAFMLLAAATGTAERTVAPLRKAEICAAEISGCASEIVTADIVPLQATVVAHGSRLASEVQLSEKGDRYPELLSSAARPAAVGSHDETIGSADAGFWLCPPNMRATDRYVYALRKIRI